MGAFYTSKRTIPVLVVGVLFLLASRSVSAQNLLANPGFEDLSADIPLRWDRFVQPKPGAAATLSDEAHGGRYSIWLHTPTPYEKEPVNNWSQNIIAELGGATLRVSGHIRVEDAKEAAIWVQFWRKKPWGVLGAESTSIDSPVYGTQDWQEVAMEVDVPEGTDFITVRCVLLGTGSAWFDDIAVTRQGGADESEESDNGKVIAASTADEPDVAVPGRAVEKPAEAMVEPTDQDLPLPAPESTDLAGPTNAVLPMVTQLEAEVRRLRDANLILTGTLEDIQAVNEALLREMLSVQAEIETLRADKAAARAPSLEPSRPRVPPLIPLSQAREADIP